MADLSEQPAVVSRVPSRAAGPSPTLPLILATISFAVSFAAWGLVGGLASVFAALYALTASQTALLVAVPVLLGSLARLPMGMLTDRFGGRPVFAALLLFSSLAAFVVPLTTSYGTLLVSAFLIGMAGSSFAVGAAFVSRWTPAARQGTALGVYGLGTMGQSVAVFAGPVVAARWGWETVFYATSALLLGWAALYVALARNPPGAARPANVSAMVAVLRRSPTAWLLGAFYFLTFGGFVAFSIYLPTLLRAQFGLAPADAGFRAAGFVVLATLMRPLGGWLADRIGGAQVLSWVFGGVSLFALLMMWPSMVPFTVGALGCAMLLGLGNVLPRAKPNWWFGVRTPWTLSSERVWTRTHRVAGYSLFGAGLAMVAMAFATAPWARLALIAVVAVGALLPVVYSYLAWRKEVAS